MVGLGILAAGAAQGAAHASNMNVQAQNQLEMGQQREALREAFLNRRFDKELAVSRENSKAAGLLREQEYQRNRADKLTDAEMRHKQALDIEGRRDARSAASNATRLKAAEIRKSSPKDSDLENNDLYVTLQNGKKYLPQTEEEKKARTIVLANPGTSFEEALMQNKAVGFVGNATRDPIAVFSSQGNGITGKAREMVDQIYKAPKVERFKLEDLLK